MGNDALKDLLIRLYAPAVVVVVAALTVQSCDEEPEVHTTAISTAGEPAPLAELQGRIEFLELRAAARDDAISALLLRCGGEP